MACLNDGSLTHTNRAKGTSSAPDTTVVHSALLEKITWKVCNNLGSDHLPILITYKSKFSKVNSTPKFKWKLEEARWKEYSEEIEKNIPTTYMKRKNPSQKYINKLEKKFRKITIKAANEYVGKKKVGRESRCWLTPEIKEAIEERNQLRKTFAANREECIQASRNVAEMIKEKNTEKWKTYMEEIDVRTDPRKVWEDNPKNEWEISPGQEQ